MYRTSHQCHRPGEGANLSIWPTFLDDDELAIRNVASRHQRLTQETHYIRRKKPSLTRAQNADMHESQNWPRALLTNVKLYLIYCVRREEKPEIY